MGVFAFKQTVDDVIKDLKSRMNIYGDSWKMEEEPDLEKMSGFLDETGYMMEEKMPNLARASRRKMHMIASVLKERSKVRTASRRRPPGIALVVR